MSTDLEAALRAGMRAEAAAVDVPDDLPARIQARATRHRRERRSLKVAVAAVMVLVVGSAMVLASRSGTSSNATGDDTRPAAVGSPAEGFWEPLPEAPIEPRFQQGAVWTGQEMIVLGGYGEDDAVHDAAAYTPATGAWREVADPPDGFGGSPIAAWTGEEVVAFGCAVDDGDCSTPIGAAYDPAADDWRTIVDPPSDIGPLTTAPAHVSWTGEDLLVVSSITGETVDESTNAALYDPASDTWTSLPEAPELVPIFADAFWTGREMILIGSENGSGLAAPSRIVALALDPEARSWRTLPEPPIGPRSHMLAAWTGTELVIGGGIRPDGQRTADRTDAVAWDPATDRWRALPDAPVAFAGSERYPDAVVGDQVVAFDTADPEGRPLLLDVDAGTWTLGPPIDIPERRADNELPGRDEVPAVSTGDAILVWGGGVSRQEGEGQGCCRPVGEGLVYTPPG
jgi:hypothetical protein